MNIKFGKFTENTRRLIRKFEILNSRTLFRLLDSLSCLIFSNLNAMTMFCFLHFCSIIFLSPKCFLLILLSKRDICAHICKNTQIICVLIRYRIQTKFGKFDKVENHFIGLIMRFTIVSLASTNFIGNTNTYLYLIRRLYELFTFNRF